MIARIRPGVKVRPWIAGGFVSYCGALLGGRTCLFVEEGPVGP